MSAHILVAILCCGSDNLEDGTLLALQGSNKIVAQYTDSSVTHLALVVNIADRPWVYEATPAEVRRLPLAEYYREIGHLNARRREQIHVWVYRPRRRYAPAQIAGIKAYLDGQLGRRYSVKKYVRRRTGDGIHCAELVSTALTRSGRFVIQNGHVEDPESVLVKVKHWYQPPVLATIRRPPVTESWCTRAWASWSGFYHWCCWACYETWTWCW